MPFDPDSLAQPNPCGLFGRLWHSYIRKNLPLIIVAFVILIIDGSTLGALSYLLEPLFDKVLAGASGDGAPYAVGLRIIGLFLIRAITSILSKTHIASAQG